MSVAASVRAIDRFDEPVPRARRGRATRVEPPADLLEDLDADGPSSERPVPLAFVDRFVDRALGRRGRFAVTLVVAAAAASSTLAFAKLQGAGDLHACLLAAAATLFGLLVVPLLVVLVKLAMVASVVATIGFVGYSAARVAFGPTCVESLTPAVVVASPSAR